MRRLVGSTAVTVVVVLALAACNQVPPQTDAEGMLVPGGSYEDDGGFVIGALPGTLEAGVGVSVRTVGAPEVDLPQAAQVIGEFQRVSAVQDVYGLENPFVLAYPVPVSADTGSLALAVLLEPDDMTDVDESTGPRWQLLPGVYDPEGGYFVTTMALLASTGRIVVLVEAPGWSSPQLSASPALLPQQTEGEFLVSCAEFDGDVNNRNITCTDNDETDLEQALEDAFADYTGLGFVHPYLARRIDEDASSFHPNNYNIVFAEYLAELRPLRDVDEEDERWPCGQTPDGTTNLGGYSSSTQTFFVCIGSGGVSTRAQETARHEYFHATQYGYAAVRASNQKWVKESTASASEGSMASMARDSSRGLRDVDRPLTAVEPGTIEYNTQDFFVYTGVRLGRGLDYLIDVYEAGASTGDVDAALGFLGVNGGLESLYWSWAKNQAFEAMFDLGGGELGASCEFTPGTATPVQVTYDHVSPPAARTVTLPPLTSSVLQIEFAALPDADYATQVTVEEFGVSDLDAVRVKFYDSTAAGTSDCWAAPESNQLDVMVNAGQPRTFYALISNLQRSSSAGAEVEFGASEPGLEILGPSNNAVFSEGDDVEFLAVATGLGGESPSATLVTWTYPRYDGVPIIFSSESGEAVTRQFCDGSYTVVAEAIDAITSETVSESVTFTVSNASPPPPECSPSIDVMEPNDGDTFALGESVSFEAVIDDDKPGTDDPLHPIIWRDGGPTGLIIAQDTLFFSRDKFSEGMHEIHVEYGIASDSVTIEIVDTSNTSPTASITSPADGAQFSYTTLGVAPQVDFSGSGSDDEDGTLSGSDLTWSYLREGSVDWVGGGSGATFTLNVSYSSDNATTYRVRLRATDSEGLFDVHEIEISILNPPS